MKTPFWTLVLATLLIPLLASPAAAAEAGGPAVFGASYWQAFVDYWKGFIQQQNGIVLAVLGLGAVALFIITRGKWQK